MKSRRRRSRGPSALLLFLCLVLGGALYAIIEMDRQSRPGGRSVATTETTPAEADTPAVAMTPQEPPPPRDAYSAFVERPLFDPSRRPPEPEAEVVEEAAPAALPNIFALVGIIIDGGTRIAFLQQRSPLQVYRVVEGQEIEGWAIETIGLDRVVLRQGSSVVEIELQEAAAVRPEPVDRREPVDRAEPEEEPTTSEEERD